MSRRNNCASKDGVGVKKALSCDYSRQNHYYYDDKNRGDIFDLIEKMIENSIKLSVWFLSFFEKPFI